MAEYIRAIAKQQSNQYYSAILNSLILVKCFQTKLWENSPYVCRQLKKIGQVSARALVDAGKINFKELQHTSPREFERVSFKIC